MGLNSDSGILIWILFDSKTDTWQLLIAWYRFVRIRLYGRWILWDVDGPDLSIPVRVSDLIEAAGSRSDGEKRKRGAHLGFRREFTGESASRRSPAVLRRLLGNGRATTRCRVTRRRWWRGKVLGSFLQQRWHVTGGSGRVGEVVGTGNIIGYRGNEGLRTYQGLERD
jgi:hypothetical protein